LNIYFATTILTTHINRGIFVKAEEKKKLQNKLMEKLSQNKCKYIIILTLWKLSYSR